MGNSIEALGCCHNNDPQESLVEQKDERKKPELVASTPGNTLMSIQDEATQKKIALLRSSLEKNPEKEKNFELLLANYKIWEMLEDAEKLLERKFNEEGFEETTSKIKNSCIRFKIEREEKQTITKTLYKKATSGEIYESLLYKYLKPEYEKQEDNSYIESSETVEIYIKDGILFVIQNTKFLPIIKWLGDKTQTVLLIAIKILPNGKVIEVTKSVELPGVPIEKDYEEIKVLGSTAVYYPNPGTDSDLEFEAENEIREALPESEQGWFGIASRDRRYNYHCYNVVQKEMSSITHGMYKKGYGNIMPKKTEGPDISRKIGYWKAKAKNKEGFNFDEEILKLSKRSVVFDEIKKNEKEEKEPENVKTTWGFSWGNKVPIKKEVVEDEEKTAVLEAEDQDKEEKNTELLEDNKVVVAPEVDEQNQAKPDLVHVKNTNEEEEKEDGEKQEDVKESNE